MRRMANRRAPDAAADPAGEFPLDPGLYLMHLTVVVARRRETHMEQALHECRLNPAGFRAMRVINQFGSATMGELADYTLTDRTTLTRVIDGLVTGGLLIRSTPAGDRRKVVLELTPLGASTLARAREAVGPSLLSLMNDLPEDDIRRADRLLTQIVARLADSEKQLDRLLWRNDAAPPSRGRKRKAAV
jgi:DNA-binding MarR family transcriptional regulator